MTNQMVVTVAIKLLVGLFAALSSLLLWSKTRDAAWLTMVIGVVFLYLETLLEILDLFGFIIYKSYTFLGIELLPLLFGTLPFICFGSGMVIFLFRIRKF